MNPQSNCKNEAIVREWLKMRNYELVKEFSFERMGDDYKEEYYRKEGVIIVLSVNLVYGISEIYILSKILRKDDNYEKVLSLRTGWAQPNKKESVFYQCNQILPFQTTFDELVRYIETIESICEKDYDFTNFSSRCYSYYANGSYQILELLDFVKYEERALESVKDLLVEFGFSLENEINSSHYKVPIKDLFYAKGGVLVIVQTSNLQVGGITLISQVRNINDNFDKLAALKLGNCGVSIFKKMNFEKYNLAGLFLFKGKNMNDFRNCLEVITKISYQDYNLKECNIQHLILGVGIKPIFEFLQYKQK